MRNSRKRQNNSQRIIAAIAVLLLIAAALFIFLGREKPLPEETDLSEEYSEQSLPEEESDIPPEEESRPEETASSLPEQAKSEPEESKPEQSKPEQSVPAQSEAPQQPQQTAGEVTVKPSASISAGIPRELILVNPENSVPDEYVLSLKELPNGLYFDSTAYDSLLRMLADGEKEGIKFVINSAYRSKDYQQMLFNNQIASWEANGYSTEQARIKAAQVVAVPGTSEHQLGLAADIVGTDYQILDDNQAYTAAQQWLMKNCSRYGFILRYPYGTTEITGIIYEPWHYRYVGVEVAEYITENNITFEEYYDLMGWPR